MGIKVINRHLCVGKDAIYVGRGTPLGNPFKLRNLGGEYTREEALHMYYHWLRTEWKKNSLVKAELIRLAKLYKKTGNLVLSCSCKPLACHGDIIVTALEAIVAKHLV